MHISFALFADAANLSQEGKLNILGVFDAVQVGALPSVHPRATLVVRLKGTPQDAGTHTLAMHWVNPQGESIWSSDGHLDVGAPPPGVMEMDLPLIAALDLPLDQAGTYTLRLSLDGDLVSEIPLVVRSAAPPPMLMGQPSGMLLS